MTGSPIGKQDQFISSYGGVNHIKFSRNDSVIVKKFNNKKILDEFQKNLIYSISSDLKATVTTSRFIFWL